MKKMTITIIALSLLIFSIVGASMYVILHASDDPNEDVVTEDFHCETTYLKPNSGRYKWEEDDWLSDILDESLDDIDEIHEVSLDDGYIYIDIPFDKDQQRFVQDIARKYSVELSLVYAMIDTESDFREDIGTEKILGGNPGEARYYGYMQLSIENCRELQNKHNINPHTPEGNIEAGIILISELRDKYNTKYQGDELAKHIIACYRAGETCANSFNKYPKYVEQEFNLYSYYNDLITVEESLKEVY